MPNDDKYKNPFKILSEFTEKYARLYIYGTGIFGEMYHRICENVGIKIDGFIVSEKTSSNKNDLPIFEIDIIAGSLDETCGIIIGVSNKIEEEIIDRLKYYNVGKLVLTDAEKKEMFYKSLTYGTDVQWKEKGIINNIAFIRLDNLGDMLMTIPMIREVHNNWPSAIITVIARRPLHELFRYCPYVDHAIGFDLNASLDEKKLLGRKYLSGVDVLFLPKSQGMGGFGRGYMDELLLMSVAMDCKKVGWMFGRPEMMDLNEDFYIIKDYLVPSFSDFYFFNEQVHDVEYMLKILERMGGRIYDKNLEIWYGKTESQWIENELKKYNISRDIKLIAIGLTGSSDAQNWPKTKYKELLEILYYQNRQLHFIILGSDERAMEYADCLRGVPGVVDLVGKTDLLQLAAAIDKCDLYVGSDTGLMHMAAALNKPVVEISFGLPDAPRIWHGSPAWTGAYGVPLTVCMAHHGIEGCAKVCNKPYHCISTISVQDVIKAMEEYL